MLMSAAATTAPGQISRVFGRGDGSTRYRNSTTPTVNTNGSTSPNRSTAQPSSPRSSAASRVALIERLNTISVAEPSTSDRSRSLRRMIGGRVWMSHAWLIAWRSAPITPLAATINSRMLTGPSRPVLSSASPTVRSRCSRSLSSDSGTLSKITTTTRSRISASSKNRPKPPTSNIASGMNESTAKNAICAASRCPRSSTNSRHAFHSASRLRSTIRRAFTASGPPRTCVESVPLRLSGGTRCAEASGMSLNVNGAASLPPGPCHRPHRR